MGATMSIPRSLFAILPVLLLLSPALLADGDPSTDNVPRLFSYGGVLERDGQGLSGEVTLTFQIYDGDDAQNTSPVWIETQRVPIYAGRFSVLLGECDDLGVTERCPLGDETSGVYIADIVRNADDLHLGVIVDDGNGPVALQHLKRWLPVAFAQMATNAADFDVANRLSVKGPLEVQAILPKAQNWSSLGLGDNEAGIYSDTGDYKKLMLVGNSSAGGQREVGIWDNLSVANDLAVGGDLSVSGAFNIDGIDASCPNNSLHDFGKCWIYLSGYTRTYFEAARDCKNQGAHLCSLAEMSGLQAAGAERCGYGWVADRSDLNGAGWVSYPMQHADPNCGNSNGLHTWARSFGIPSGANCCK